MDTVPDGQHAEPDAIHGHEGRQVSPEWDMTRDWDEDVDIDVQPSDDRERTPPLLLYLPIEVDEQFREPSMYYGLWNGFPYDISRAKKCIQAALLNYKQAEPVCALSTAEQLWKWQKAWPSEDKGYEQPPMGMKVLFRLQRPA
ncbi:hypothetical protein BKA62DRAFT_775559 [Auriculariales sp. MPI-PUGE-AT-0066]|nr:hypothetical protein BKA62DRAFT_775559 [Auriculariales sp. MPI-PUGE-AT-0066]